MQIKSTLSSRGNDLKDAGPPVDLWKKILGNPYDPNKNPEGVVNLGVAENYTMLQDNAKYINEKLKLESLNFSYGSGPWGSEKIRKAMSAHLNEHFSPHQPVKPDMLHFANGVTSLCEMLGYTIFDEGDCLLLSSPIYQAFKMDFGTKAKVECIYTHFSSTDQFSPACISHYEDAIKSATASGKRIRALMLCNPHNPLGKCYPASTIIALMELCQRHEIHLFADEIYALSVYPVPDEHAVPFTSILSLDTDKYIDPNYLHHLYGFSKDFAAGGIRVGCLTTRNAELRRALAAVSPFGWSGGINEEVACCLLDKEYLDDFLPRSKERLRNNNVLVRKLLDECGIGYAKGANAGFFIWIDLRPWLPRPRLHRWDEDGEEAGWKAEDALTMELIQHGVFITNGKEMSAEEPGWYRLIFAQDERFVREGIERIAKTLEDEESQMPRSQRPQPNMRLRHVRAAMQRAILSDPDTPLEEEQKDTRIFRNI